MLQAAVLMCICVCHLYAFPRLGVSEAGNVQFFQPSARPSPPASELQNSLFKNRPISQRSPTADSCGDAVCLRIRALEPLDGVADNVGRDLMAAIELDIRDPVAELLQVASVLCGMQSPLSAPPCQGPPYSQHNLKVNPWRQQPVWLKLWLPERLRHEQRPQAQTCSHISCRPSPSWWGCLLKLLTSL